MWERSSRETARQRSGLLFRPSPLSVLLPVAQASRTQRNKQVDEQTGMLISATPRLWVGQR